MSSPFEDGAEETWSDEDKVFIVPMMEIINQAAASVGPVATLNMLACLMWSMYQSDAVEARHLHTVAMNLGLATEPKEEIH